MHNEGVRPFGEPCFSEFFMPMPAGASRHLHARLSARLPWAACAVRPVSFLSVCRWLGAGGVMRAEPGWRLRASAPVRLSRQSRMRRLDRLLFPQWRLLSQGRCNPGCRCWFFFRVGHPAGFSDPPLCHHQARATESWTTGRGNASAAPRNTCHAQATVKRAWFSPQWTMPLSMSWVRPHKRKKTRRARRNADEQVESSNSLRAVV